MPRNAGVLFSAKIRRGAQLAGVLFAAMLTASAGAAQANIRLTSTQLPLALRATTASTRLAPATPITFDITLPIRNEAQLDTLLTRLYNPSDSLYGKYLTPAQFRSEFGPTESTVETVNQFAASSGLTVIDVAKNNTYVRVTGTSSQVEKVLGVQLYWHSDATGRSFYGPDREPTVPQALAAVISGFSGLDTAGKGHPDYIKEGSVKALATQSHSLSTTGGKPLINFTGNAGLAPDDVKKIYTFSNSTYTGAGETVAVFEQGTFYPSDPEFYQSYYGLASPTYTPVSIDGFDTDPSTHAPDPSYAEPEADLDLELWSAFAPGVSQVKVYEADDTGSMAFVTEITDAFEAMANDDTGLASVISVSYGESELNDITQSEAETENVQLKQMAAQGQSVFISSGDSGAYDEYGYLTPDDPGVQPYVTDVGGTNLFDSTDEAYQLETSWGDYYVGNGGGGGISNYWSIPTWQTGAFTAAGNPQGSLTYRNEPDVSLFASPEDQGYDEYEFDLTSEGYAPWFWDAGTSAAAPLWAAFAADANQARKAEGAAPLGFANPLLYKIAESSHYGTDFHDVTTGANLYYDAVPGYDNSTGWGSFQGNALFSDLIANPAIKSFSPSAAVVGGIVTITGTGLTTATTISFNGTVATFKINSPTSIAATVPSGATVGPIRIQTAIDTKLVSATNFTPVQITSFTPSSGTVGSTVALTGTGFTGASAVSLDGYPAVYTVNSDTSITFTVPKGAATGPIHVKTAGGLAVSTTNFTVTTTPAPAVSSFAPSSGKVGSVVTVMGVGFTGVTAVSVGGYPATFTVLSDTSLKFTVPKNAASGAVHVKASAGLLASATTFTVST